MAQTATVQSSERTAIDRITYQDLYARWEKGNWRATELDFTQDRSLPNFAAAITMYHLLVEATLAQPGQHFIESYVTERGILPGFRQGMENVSRDEQRHIGFGVKCLSDCVKQDPDCKYAVADL